MGIKTLFRIDIYFTNYLLAVQVDGKGHTDRDLIFEEKRQEALGKKLDCTFIRIHASKKGYNEHYEASRVQTFISEFKNKKFKKFVKESNKKIKESKNKIKQK